MEERTRPLGVVGAERDQRRLSPGESIDDWIVVREIGGGGFGVVYEARHRTTDQPVALKLLHAHLVASPEMVARFHREATAIDRVRHPAIVALVALGVSDGRPYLCMELLGGEDLDAIVRRTGPMSGLQALAILDPVCSALAAAHELGVVHRDVKASNVMVCSGAGGRSDRVVLLDFGIAKLSDALADLTASHQSLGTPSCMAPEQVHGRTVDARSDVYGLGTLAFYLLTGHMPFEDASLTMTQYLHLHARRPRVSLSASVPARVDDVVARAMAIQPAERFSDPLSLLAALRSALRDSAPFIAVEVADAAAILVAVRDAGAGLDEALVTDLEAVLPAAERALSAAGFALALDLGASAVFAHHHCDAEHAVATAIAVWDQLAQRGGRDPRVRIGICVHRAAAVFHGTEIRSGTLLRPASWGIPDELDGVWVTAAVTEGATTATRLVDR
jgi:serine/threonine-protein kinase